jgi:hypothetical protein
VQEGESVSATAAVAAMCSFHWNPDISWCDRYAEFRVQVDPSRANEFPAIDITKFNNIIGLQSLSDSLPDHGGVPRRDRRVAIKTWQQIQRCEEELNLIPEEAEAGRLCYHNLGGKLHELSDVACSVLDSLDFADSVKYQAFQFLPNPIRHLYLLGLVAKLETRARAAFLQAEMFDIVSSASSLWQWRKASQEARERIYPFFNPVTDQAITEPDQLEDDAVNDDVASVHSLHSKPDLSDVESVDEGRDHAAEPDPNEDQGYFRLLE